MSQASLSLIKLTIKINHHILVLALVSLCLRKSHSVTQATLESQWSCLSYLSVGIIGVCYHVLLPAVTFHHSY